jgi:hypothetical protein
LTALWDGAAGPGPGRRSGTITATRDKQLGTTGLADQVERGERPRVFAFPLAGAKVSWCKTLGGYAMKIDAGDRKWIVSLNYPSGGGVWQLLNIISSRSTTWPWKQAIAAAGAA